MAWFTKTNTEKLLAHIQEKERYLTLRKLGAGALSDVSCFFDKYLHRKVAVKVLKEKHLQHFQLVESFLNEIKLISFLDHPGVISLYDAFLIEKKMPAYAMKLIQGNELLKSYKQKSQSQLLEIFAKICETLAYVHDKGIIHLDLKPENIMLGEYGEVMIMDWGIARFYNQEPYYEYLKEVKGITPPPIIEHISLGSGTPLYMSPEQVTQKRDQLTPSSDIFSVGIIFYEMLTGITPFSAKTRQGIFDKVCSYNPVEMYRLNANIPLELSKICMKMLAKDPAERYSSFKDVLKDYDAFQNSGDAFAIKTYQSEEIIFAEGDLGDYAFTIISGCVEVIKVTEKGTVILAELGAGEIVGELAIFTNQLRSATIRAKEKTKIKIMKREDITEELDKLSPWVKSIITGLSKRFIQVSDQLIRKTQNM